MYLILLTLYLYSDTNKLRNGIMKKNRLCLAFFAFLLTGYAWASTPSVQLKSERHRTEWNWVEYRLSLKNLSDKPLKNPTIRYFAENPKIQFCRKNPKDASCSGAQFGDYKIDSTLRAEVDYFSTVKSVKPAFQYGSQYTVIELKFSGSIPAQKKSSVNFRIMKKNYPAWDCTHDYSFQKNAAVQEKNYMMAVYDAEGNLLWGNDPVALEHDAANVYWNDRSGMTVVSQYDGSDSAKAFDGRFWMLEGNSLSYKERKALDSIGVRILESTRYENKDLHLLKAVKAVTKKTLSKVISGFYNAFKVDDTTHLTLEVSHSDIYEEKKNCDANGTCSNVVNERSAFDLIIECWPDISMNACKDFVLRCSGKDVYIDRNVVLANVQKNSVQCLENHKDVRFLHLHKKEDVDTYEGRTNVKIEPLQLLEDGWLEALAKPNVTTNWLHGVKYTGEGVVVDVHDDPIDFTHPGFNEIGADGKETPRKAAGYDDTRSVRVDGVVQGHGTHVSGIIGGNGRLSETFEKGEPYQYRGVAPKVKFLSHELDFQNECGNVVNHSHPVQGSDRRYYGDESARIDRTIFYNWALPSERGDNLTKTSVATSGNEGGRGYHSVTDNAKNPILIGSYNQSDKVLSVFSGMGPTWDGRIKPDLMAPGDGPQYLIINEDGRKSRTDVLYGGSVKQSLTEEEKKADKDLTNNYQKYLKKGDIYRSGIISTVPREFNGLYDDWYGPKAGTSQAAPFVTGIVALMYQKFHEQTGVSLDKLSMRNSTTKALLIHTAKDMVGSSSKYGNHDLCRVEGKCYATPYTVGPDFATGWGMVDGEAALGMIDKYDGKKFAKFREINVFARYESRWTIDVGEKKSFRTTLVWDDAPGNVMDVYTNSKLVNDLDLWLVSPSGKIYYPWRLDPLPKKNIDVDGNLLSQNIVDRTEETYENIDVEDVKKVAYKHCSPMQPTTLFEGCFDRLNNVEVVDVDAADAEVGTWQVVVKGYRITSGNGPAGHVQIASLASDYELKDPVKSKSDNVPAPAFELQTPEVRYWGDGYLEHYVYFGPETQFGDGGHILLFDGFDGFIGDFSDDNPLANRRIVVKSSFLQMVPVRKSTTAPWPKYSMGEVHIPYGVLQVLFPPYKKK